MQTNTGNVQQALQVAATTQRGMAAKGANGGKELGKEDFLNLLMTQMANQDPMDPTNTDSMMQQLASMGTVEQLQNLNSKTDTLLGIQGNISKAASGSLLGKDVELGVRSIPLRGGATAPVSYKLEGDADRILVNIFDDRGQMVREIKGDARAQGTHRFLWDGKDSQGDVMPDATYRYDIIAQTDTGENINVSLSKTGRVSNLRFNKNQQMVQVNGEWLAADQIQGMGNKSEQLYDTALPLPIHKELAMRKMLGTPQAAPQAAPAALRDPRNTGNR